MTTWIHRTLIVPANQVELARSLCAALVGPAGEGMFNTPLSPTGLYPATHYISTGLIEEQFANLLPLTAVASAEDGTPTTSIQPGDAALTAQLEADVGLSFMGEEISTLFASVDVSEQLAEEAFVRLGLQMIAEPEV